MSETGDLSGVTAALARLLTGLAVGLPTDRVVCVGCATQLTEGRVVTVYGYRRAKCLEWDLWRCYCADCAPTTVDETQGCVGISRRYAYDLIEEAAEVCAGVRLRETKDVQTSTGVEHKRPSWWTVTQFVWTATV